MSFVNKLFKTTEILTRNNGFRFIFLKYDANHSFQSFSTKIEIPLPPKKPMSAYMIFCKESRPSLLQEDPSLKSTQQIRILAEKWSHLSPELRKPYEDSARESTIRYGEMHKNFYEQLTDEQRLELARIKEEKRKSRKLSKLKKALKDSNMPQRPRSGYIIYVQSEFHKRTESQEPSKSLKELAVNWRKLSEEEKQPFYEKSAIEKEQYDIKMREWSERLEEEGRANLLVSYKETKEKLKTLSIVSKSSQARGRKNETDSKSSSSKNL